jgi:acetyl esterase/lipase
MRKLLALVVLASSLALAQISDQPQPRAELLWPDGAPGALGSEDADRPTLTPYLPDPAKASRTGIVVCPGGGYRALAMDHEGRQVAQWLNAIGVAAFVLKYRLGPRYHHPAELHDAQQALRLVRSKAGLYNVLPDRIGIMGFSAGGHLASTAGTHFTAESRPSFMILIYPVISFTQYVHRGSLQNLLGDHPDPRLVENLSNELQVTSQTPPAFLVHTSEDTAVPAENSVLFYLALKKAGVPAEMHIYEKGRHGFGLAPSDPILASWPRRLAAWLKLHGWLDR